MKLEFKYRVDQIGFREFKESLDMYITHAKYLAVCKNDLYHLIFRDEFGNWKTNEEEICTSEDRKDTLNILWIEYILE